LQIHISTKIFGDAYVTSGFIKIAIILRKVQAHRFLKFRGTLITLVSPSINRDRIYYELELKSKPDVFPRNNSIFPQMYSASILWFQNQDKSSLNDYHWSLFVSPVDNKTGTKYDVFYVGNEQWTPSYSPDFNLSETADLGGCFSLGDIAAEKFLEIMLETSLPGQAENCQTWVRKVIQKAVQKRVLPSNAATTLASVPIRPSERVS